MPKGQCKGPSCFYRGQVAPTNSPPTPPPTPTIKLSEKDLLLLEQNGYIKKKNVRDEKVRSAPSNLKNVEIPITFLKIRSPSPKNTNIELPRDIFSNIMQQLKKQSDSPEAFKTLARLTVVNPDLREEIKDKDLLKSFYKKLPHFYKKIIGNYKEAFIKELDIDNNPNDRHITVNHLEDLIGVQKTPGTNNYDYKSFTSNWTGVWYTEPNKEMLIFYELDASSNISCYIVIKKSETEELYTKLLKALEIEENINQNEYNRNQNEYNRNQRIRSTTWSIFLCRNGNKFILKQHYNSSPFVFTLSSDKCTDLSELKVLSAKSGFYKYTKKLSHVSV